MDLTFQVLMQHCSLQLRTLLSPPDTSTVECRFHFSPAFSFFLELFLCSCPDLLTWEAHLLMSYPLAFFYCSWGSRGKDTEVVCCSFSRDHILSELSTMACLGWPHTARLIASVSYTRLWSMWLFSLVLSNCGLLFWRLWDCSSCFFCLSSDGWG